MEIILGNPSTITDSMPRDHIGFSTERGERGGEGHLCVFFFFAHYILFMVEGEEYHHITRSGGKVNVD